MSKTNCINCGAAKETSELQCPFCGTRYADFTTFDLMSDEPIFIQLKSEGKIITAKAYITDRKLEFHPEYLDCRNLDGQLRRIRTAMNVTGSIDFVMYEGL